LLGALAAGVIAGCSEDGEAEQPPEPPTTAELSRFVAETRQPAYWLGPRYRAITVSRAWVNRGRVRLTYGPWSCNPGSGCTDTGGIWTGRRDIDVLSRVDVAERIDPKDCWSQVGKAVAALIDCLPDGYPQEVVIYSGTREIHVTSLYTRDRQGEIPARTVLRGLRPLNAHASWPLPRPRPLSCREYKRVDERYRRHMPRPLRRRPAC
jgi:hypothetical protein